MLGALPAKVGEEPEEEGEDDADKKAGGNGEVKGRVLAAMDDITREPAEAEGQLAAEIEKRTE